MKKSPLGMGLRILRETERAISQLQIRPWRYEYFHPLVVAKLVSWKGSTSERVNRTFGKRTRPDVRRSSSPKRLGRCSGADRLCLGPVARACASLRPHSTREASSENQKHEQTESSQPLKKGNAMNDNGRSKRCVLIGKSAKSLMLNASKRVRTGAVTLGVVMVLVLLNGCASVRTQDDADPWRYNPNTGYPAVGGPSWGHF